MANFVITTPPVAEPLSRTEVKDYLKVEHILDDDLIDILIQAAREYVEGYTNRKLMTQTIEEYFEGFPVKTIINPLGYFSLRFAPVSGTVTMAYYDSDNVLAFNNDIEEDLPNGLGSLMILNTDTGYNIYPPYNNCFPDTATRFDAVKITYNVGYSSAGNVPAAIKNAMLLIIAKMYESREDSVKKMPTHAQWLLNFYKIPHI